MDQSNIITMKIITVLLIGHMIL